MLTDVSTNISSFQKGVASAENETERPQSFYVVKKKEIGMFPKVFEAWKVFPFDKQSWNIMVCFLNTYSLWNNIIKGRNQP